MFEQSNRTIELQLELLEYILKLHHMFIFLKNLIYKHTEIDLKMYLKIDLKICLSQNFR